jgi:hypothetical protein
MKYRYEHIKISTDFAESLLEQDWEFDWSLRPDSDLEVINLGVYKGAVLEGLAYYSQDKRSLFNYIHLLEIAPHNRGENRINDDVAGTIFAFVARDSLEAGFEGFVVFEPKTKLRQHYQDKYEAKLLPNGRLYFDTELALRLVKEYLSGGGYDE